MLESPSVVSVSQQDVAIIRINVAKADIRTMMPLAIKELRTSLAAQGITPSGPMFTHHLVMEEIMFDLEVGFPIDRPLLESRRVRAGSLPAAAAAVATYRGGYEGLPAAWAELQRWVEANGYARATDLWEIYARGPEAGSNQAEWRTELFQPLGSR